MQIGIDSYLVADRLVWVAHNVVHTELWEAALKTFSYASCDAFLIS